MNTEQTQNEMKRELGYYYNTALTLFGAAAARINTKTAGAAVLGNLFFIALFVGGGYWGGGSFCPNCTIYNHNETLIEDVD